MTQDSIEKAANAIVDTAMTGAMMLSHSEHVALRTTLQDAVESLIDQCRAYYSDLSRAGAVLGASTSHRKRFSSRENGKRGGRPPKPASD